MNAPANCSNISHTKPNRQVCRTPPSLFRTKKLISK